MVMMLKKKFLQKKDYEKKFKSHETNLSFCNAFIKKEGEMEKH